MHICTKPPSPIYLVGCQLPCITLLLYSVLIIDHIIYVDALHVTIALLAYFCVESSAFKWPIACKESKSVNVVCGRIGGYHKVALEVSYYC